MPADRLGLIALVVALAGTILACLPPVFFLGWIALPVGLTLAIVALRRPARRHGAAVAAVVVSIVGFIAGAVVFVVMLLVAFGEAVGPESSREEARSMASAERPADQEAPAVSMIQASSQARSFHAA